MLPWLAFCSPSSQLSAFATYQCIISLQAKLPFMLSILFVPNMLLKASEDCADSSDKGLSTPSNFLTFWDTIDGSGWFGQGSVTMILMVEWLL